MSAPPDTEALELFNSFFARHYAEVFAFFLRRTDQRSDAEDLTANTFAIVWRRVGEIDESRDQRTWVLSIAGGVLSNYWRANRRRRHLVDALARTRVDDTPSWEGEGLALTAFARLRPAEQEALRLVLWDELTPAEAASVSNCSLSAFKVRFHRARKAFIRHYEIVRSVPLSDGDIAVGIGGAPSHRGAT